MQSPRYTPVCAPLVCVSSYFPRRTVMTPVPRWTRFLDLLAIFLIILAPIVAASGGFRQHIGGLRLSITSPWPLLIWAAVIGVARQIAAPQFSVYSDLRARIAAVVRRPEVSASVRATVGTRPAILLIGYLSVFSLGFADGRAPLRYFDNELLNLPVRWDAGWYLAIVTDGYRFTSAEPERQQNIVFFPAYPILVRMVGRLLGGHLSGYVAAGTAISLSAFSGALVYLFLFTRRVLESDRAEAALWLLATYPFALFFGAVYTESLYLLAVVGAFYHYTRGEFGRAGLWGLIAGLTRINGAFLSFALALLALTAVLPAHIVSRDREQTRAWNPDLAIPGRGIARPLVAAAMPGIGLLIYTSFVWKLTGDPLAWMSAHAAWGRTNAGLAALVSQQYSIVTREGLSGYLSTPGYDALNAIGALFALLAVWPVARRVGLAYGVFVGLNTLSPLASGGLLSAGRFSSVAFPAFVWLAAVIQPRGRAAWIASFAALQAYNAALYYTWRPLF
jgi:hypothetical protein